MSNLTEMEMLLRKCVEDVRDEISRRNLTNLQLSESSNKKGWSPLYMPKDNVSPNEFTKEDRERALELLLSQERVISLIYSKTFPVAGQGNANTGLNSKDGGKDAAELNEILNGMGELENSSESAGVKQEKLPNIVKTFVNPRV